MFYKKIKQIPDSSYVSKKNVMQLENSFLNRLWLISISSQQQYNNSWKSFFLCMRNNNLAIILLGSHVERAEQAEKL